MKSTATYEILDRYEVTIRPSRYGGGPSLEWRVVAPDGRVAQGTTFAPAWRWVARRAALKAARWLAHSDEYAEHYFLRRERRTS